MDLRVLVGEFVTVMVGNVAAGRQTWCWPGWYILGIPRVWHWITYISQRLIKANHTRLHSSPIHTIRGKLHLAVLLAYTPPTCIWLSTFCAVGATKLVYRSKSMWLAILHEQQPSTSQEVICPWTSAAYRLEAYLFYRSLKHSNLHLKPNLISLSPHLNCVLSQVLVCVVSTWSYWHLITITLMASR